MADTPTCTADDLFEAIKVRFDAPWVLRREVTLKTRRIDVVAFGMPGSTGCRIIAIELKVSRGDWLRELQNFQKSEAWANEADGYLVVTPKGVIKDGELPQGWGHLEWTGTKLMTRAHALYREHRGEMSRELAMRIIRRAHEDVDQALRTERHRMEAEVRKKVEERLRDQHEMAVRSLRADLAAREQELREIYAAAGIERRMWNSHEKMLAACAALTEARSAQNPNSHMTRQLAGFRDHYRSIAEQIDKAMQTLTGTDPQAGEQAGERAA